MVVEVHTRKKPAIVRRVWFASLLLLAVACALAAAMTWSRSGQVLSPRVEPLGWSLSFRPPRNFRHGQIGPTRLGQAHLFFGQTEGGMEVVLGVYRMTKMAGEDAQAVCEHVLGVFERGLPSIGGMAPVTWFDRKLGPLDAVEVWDPLLGMVIRATVLRNGEAYAMYFAVEGPIDRNIYRVFDLACDSVEYRSP